MSAVDYADWLTPVRLEIEERLWEQVAIYRLYAEALQRVLEVEGCRSVIELGCGTGWVPTRLSSDLDYLGVDANPGCLALARRKTSFPFLQADIRQLETPVRDMVCAFAVLKHFALQEWQEIVVRMLALGRVGVFTMNVGPDDLDDSSHGFPHTWVSRETLEWAIRAGGHDIVEMALLHTGETIIRTRRCNGLSN